MSMLKPFKVCFYVYADSSEEADSLGKEMTSFVRDCYASGTIVRASKLRMLLSRIKGNTMIMNFLRVNDN